MCDPSTRPAFQPVANGVRTRMVYNLAGSEVMNVFYFLGAAPQSLADLDVLNGEILTAWNSLLKSRQPSTLELMYIESTALDAASAPQATLGVGVFGTGTTGAELPANVTFAIKFSTGMTGRSHRGRMYWLQLGEGQVQGSNVDPTAIADITGQVASFFIAVATGASVDHVVVSYCQSNAWLTNGAPYVVTSYSYTDSVVDSQRRRLPGRGR